MATKRSAAAPAKGATAPKAAKKPSGLTAEVIKGLNASDLPKPACSMLEEMLALTLTVYKEKRDSYQSKVVDLVEGVLTAVEEGHQKRVEESAVVVAESAKEKQELATQAEAKDGGVSAKHVDVVAKKQSLAQVATSFWSAKEAVEEAALKVQTHEVEALAKVEEKDTLTKLLEDFQNQIGGSSTDLANRIKDMGANESMVLALPAMLAKPASERGSFDLMVFTSVKEWLDKRIVDTREAIANAEPTKAANANALSRAQQTLDDTRGEQLEVAEAYWKVRAEEEGFESELHTLRQSIRKLGSEGRKHQDKNTRAQVALETFQKGPKNAFEKLRDKAEEVAAAANAEAAAEVAEGAPQEPAVDAEVDAAEE